MQSWNKHEAKIICSVNVVQLIGISVDLYECNGTGVWWEPYKPTTLKVTQTFFTLTYVGMYINKLLQVIIKIYENKIKSMGTSNDQKSMETSKDQNR